MKQDWRVSAVAAGSGTTPLGLEHSQQILAALNAYHPQLSEYSFANLFLFRHVHDYYFRGGAQPLILGRTYDGHAHVMPMYDWRKGAAGLLDFAR
jgi:hypothetical protein